MKFKYNSEEHKAYAAKLAALFREIARTDNSSNAHLLRRESIDSMALRAAFDGCPESTNGVEEFLSNVFKLHPTAAYKTRQGAIDADMLLAKDAVTEPVQDADGKLRTRLTKDEIARLDPKSKLRYSYGESVLVPPAPLVPGLDTRKSVSGKAEHDTRTAAEIRSQAIAALQKANSKPVK